MFKFVKAERHYCLPKKAIKMINCSLTVFLTCSVKTALLYVLFTLHRIAKIEINQTFLEHWSFAQWCILPVSFPVIYYCHHVCHSSKSTGKEPGKTYLCAVQCLAWRWQKKCLILQSSFLWFIIFNLHK